MEFIFLGIAIAVGVAMFGWYIVFRHEDVDTRYKYENGKVRDIYDDYD